MVGHIHNLCINVLVPTNIACNVMLGRTVGKERVSEACSALSSGSSWENVARLSCVCGPSLLPDYIVMIMRNSSLLNLMLTSFFRPHFSRSLVCGVFLLTVLRRGLFEGNNRLMNNDSRVF